MMIHMGSRSFPLLFVLLDCTPPQAGSSSNYEAALVEPPGAYNLVDHSESGTQQISYELDEAYPAGPFLEQLNHNLKQLGWTPLQDSWLNPGSPSSHVSGWSHFQDATVTPTVRVDQWMAEWVNGDGAILLYVLKYSSPLNGEPSRDTLWVGATVLPPDAARAFQNQAADLADDVDQLLEVEEQARRLQEQQDASALRRDATLHGRLVLRLLDAAAPIPDPAQVLPSSFDQQVPPLELEVVHATVESDPTTGVMIRAVFSEASARKLHQFSSTYLERTAAIVVDDEVVATPFIASPLEDIVTIQGAFTIDRANEVIVRMMN